MIIKFDPAKWVLSNMWDCRGPNQRKQTAYTYILCDSLNLKKKKNLDCFLTTVSVHYLAEEITGELGLL